MALPPPPTTPPTAIPAADAEEELELAAELRLAVGRLHRRLRQQALGGLGVAQLSVLATIDRHGPLRPGELARLEGVAPPTVTRTIVRLEAAGLLARAPEPLDHRAVVVDLTAAGRRRLADVRGERTAYLTRGLVQLAPDERRALARALPLLNELAGTVA